jgi:hypothetical protein
MSAAHDNQNFEARSHESEYTKKSAAKGLLDLADFAYDDGAIFILYFLDEFTATLAARRMRILPVNQHA